MTYGDIDACIARYQVWRAYNASLLAMFDRLGLPLPPLHVYRPGYMGPR